MKLKGMNKQGLGIGMIVFLLGILSFFYWGNQKEIWFCDEVYSYESANGFEQDWPAALVDQWMSGEDVEAFFAADSDSLSLNDITVRLYNDHVPLYFWIFRMVSFFAFKGSGSIWIGLSINLFFYLIVLGVIYRIFLYLTKSPMASGMVVLFTCIINRLMLEQVTTLRMYMMLLCLELLLVLSGMWILHRADTGTLSPGAFISLFVVSLMGFLTHYDFWIFYAASAGIFCLWLLVQAFRSGKWFSSFSFRVVLVWVGNFIASLFMTIVIFPYCRWNLNQGKGGTALRALFDFSAEKWEYIVWGYRRQVAAVLGEGFPTSLGLLLLFGCIVAGAVILYRKNEQKKLRNLSLTVLICQAYQLVVCFTFPGASEERYLWGPFTIMVWCACYGGFLLWQQLFSFLPKQNLSGICKRIGAVVLVCCIVIGQLTVMDGGHGIAYLFYGAKDVEVLENHSKTPWIVYGSVMDAYSYYDLLIPERLCFLTENDTPEDAAAIREIIDKEQFILYTTEAYYSQAMDFFEQALNKKLSGEYLMRSTNLLIYLVSDAEK